MSADRRFKIMFFAVVLLALFGFGGWYGFLREDGRGIDTAQDRIVETEVAQAPVEDASANPEPIVEQDEPAQDVAQDPAPLVEVAPEVVEQLPEGAAAETETVDSQPDATAVGTEVAKVEPLVAEEPVSETPIAEAVPAPAPVFDIVRVEPTGEAVIAGRSFAGAVVELVRNGMVFDRMVADASGNFVFIPRDFPVGTSEVVLRVVGEDGAVSQSEQSVTIVVAEDLRSTPMVAIVAPNQPTVVLSRPEEVASAAEITSPEELAESVEQEADVAVADASADAATPSAEQAAPADHQLVAAAQASTTSTIRIASVEAETGGGLFVTGEAGPRALVRLYLNDTFVAPAEAAEDGTVSFAIERGVRSGTYRVRLDEVAGETGTVLSRAEIVFVVPELVAAAPAMTPAAEPEPEPASDVASDEAAETTGIPVVGGQPALEAEASAETSVVETAARTATTTIPEISTAIVTRGDSLWRISREVYGSGIRYTEIFDANKDQIRNPNLIYPGQLFVLPPDPARAIEAGEPPQAN